MPIDMGRLARFPLWPVVDGKCGCPDVECNSKPGKHPIFRWKGMGTSEKMSGPEGCGYGIATGTRSGLFVVDLDGDAAMQWWADQCEGRDVDPWVTYSVDTARGCHLYFNQPDFPVKNSASAIAKGVDVRGEGGYVCAPGTVHVSGHVYAEHDATAQILDAPAWLLECPGLRGSMREEGENAPVAVDVNTPLGMERLRAGALACATMPASVQGENGSMALWSVAMKLMRELELPVEAALELVESVYNPRCSPPWETDLILHKLENARDLSDKPTGPGKTDEEHDAFVARLKATARGLRPNAVPTRRVHNPSHTYSFTPGKDTSAMSNEPKAALTVDVANMLATHKDWDGSLQWDSFRGRVTAVDPPLRMDAEDNLLSDADISRIRAWLSCHGKLIQKDDARDAVRMAAERVTFHPIIDYLESCRGKGKGLLKNLAHRLFGVTDALSQKFMERTLVAAVRRVYDPGAKVDTVLTLMGGQGAKKSTFCKVLFGKEFLTEQLPRDLAHKDAASGIVAYWGVEIPEIERIVDSDNSTAKAYLTRQFDDYRPSFGHFDIRAPRHTVFIGTTNKHEFLTDPTGNRRYWPIQTTKKIDISFLTKHRDEIWGEALALAEDPAYEHWFEDESEVEKAHRNHIAEDTWHDTIASYLCGRTKVRSAEIYVDAIGLGKGDMTKFGRKELLRIVDVLRALGCTQDRSNGDTSWAVPEALSVLKKKHITMSERINNAHN